MDLDTVRASLPSMTRAVFGEKVTLIAMTEGKMSAVADATRPVLEYVVGRFDFAPELEQIGGGRDVPERARAVSPHGSISFAKTDLAWLPTQGDRVQRLNAEALQAETYRIDRTLEPSAGVILCMLSRV